MSEVTAKSGNAVAPVDQHAGAGFEGLDSSELLVPFIRILQPLSPECADDGVDGARPGMIINSATNQLVDGKTGGTFIPCMRERTFVEWIPRDAGGGFVGIWDVTDPRIAEHRAKQGRFGKIQLESGNDLVETYSLYGLFTTPTDEVWNCVIPFTSTQIPKYKMVVTRLANLIGNPPAYALYEHRWRVRTEAESNKKGKWNGWLFTLEGGSPATARVNRDDPLFSQAAEFHQSLKSGLAKANYDKPSEEELPF